MTEKSRLPVFLLCVLVTLTFDLRTPKSILVQMHRDTVLSYVYTSAKFRQDWMKNDREIATSDFSILCP